MKFLILAEFLTQSALRFQKKHSLRGSRVGPEPCWKTENPIWRRWGAPFTLGPGTPVLAPLAIYQILNTFHFFSFWKSVDFIFIKYKLIIVQLKIIKW